MICKHIDVQRDMCYLRISYLRQVRYAHIENAIIDHLQCLNRQAKYSTESKVTFIKQVLIQINENFARESQRDSLDESGKWFSWEMSTWLLSMHKDNNSNIPVVFILLRHRGKSWISRL